MNRRTWIALAGTAALGAACPSLCAQSAGAAARPLRSLAVLDFELVDDQNNPLTKAAQEVRLRNATQQIQRELSERGLYRVVDPAPSHALQAKLRSEQEFLYRCDDCASQAGKLLGVAPPKARASNPAKRQAGKPAFITSLKAQACPS